MNRRSPSGGVGNNLLVRWAKKRLRRAGLMLEEPAREERVSIRDTSYPVRVIQVEHHGAIAVTLHLELLQGYRLGYKAGQFVRLAVEIGHNIFQRCYSLTSSPEDAHLRITVKRVFQGRVSNYLNDRVRPGDILYLDDPSGEFVIPEKSGLEERYVFIAAGSGIVPIYSLMADLLGKNPETDIQLIYSNRSPEHALFRKEIEAMEKRNPGLRTHFMYTRKHDGGHDSKRRLNGEKLLGLIPDFQASRVYICGPAGLAKELISTLQSNGLPEGSLRVELFSTAPSMEDNALLKPRVVSFRRKGLFSPPRIVRQRQVETILETAAKNGVKIPTNCTVGNCKSCKVKLKSGHAIMDEPNSLTTAESSEGYVLACVAYPCESIEVELPS